MDIVTVSITLSESMQERIDARVRDSHYGNTSEYIKDLVRRDLEEHTLARLRALIEEGLASGPPERFGAAERGRFYEEVTAELRRDPAQ